MDFDIGTISTPSGWTQLFTTADTAGGGGYRMAGFYKVASGSEGSTVSVTTSVSTNGRHIAYRITGYQGTPECGTTANGSGTTANPPSLSPSWSTADTLWIALASQNGGAFSASPTNYANPADSGTNFLRMRSADRSLNAATEDHGTFTHVNGTWLAQTNAIRPVTASAYSVTADAGSYAYTGKTTTLYHASKVIVGAGSYVLSGQAISLKRTARLPVGVGSYSYLGKITSLKRTARLPVGVGSYAFTGKDVAVLRGKAILVDAGNYALSGQDAGFLRFYVIKPVAGVYLLDGQLVDVLRTARQVPLAGSYSLGGKDVELLWGQSPFWQPEGGSSGGWSSESGLSGSWTAQGNLVGGWSPEGGGQ
jgi:hypothetical protein